MQVTAIKTFLNAHTLKVHHAGDTIDLEDSYAGDLQKRGIVATVAAPQASRQGFVPPVVTPPAAPTKK
jgi:hypothetical protein